MKTVYREKRYYCGEYLDVYIYPTYRQGRSRGKRSKPTSAAQAKLNQRHREEKLVRLLHANFTPDDLEIHLTYQQQPESPEEAQRLLRNYIRRVQRARKKQGLPPLKYIAVTEKGSKNGRYPAHEEKATHFPALGGLRQNDGGGRGNVPRIMAGTHEKISLVPHGAERRAALS